MLVEWKHYKAFPGLTSYGAREVTVTVRTQSPVNSGPIFSHDSLQIYTHTHIRTHRAKCSRRAGLWFLPPARAPCSTWPHHGLQQSQMPPFWHLLSGALIPWVVRGKEEVEVNRGSQPPFTKGAPKQNSLCYNLWHTCGCNLFITNLCPPLLCLEPQVD